MQQPDSFKTHSFLSLPQEQGVRDMNNTVSSRWEVIFEPARFKKLGFLNGACAEVGRRNKREELEKPLPSILVDFTGMAHYRTKANSTLDPTFPLYDPQSHRPYSPASGNTSLTHGGFEMSSRCHLRTTEARDQNLKGKTIKRQKKRSTNIQNSGDAREKWVKPSLQR